jgi:hypothetical protein
VTREEYRLGGAIDVARRGTDLPQSKLTPDLVRSIRINWHGKTCSKWADELGLHKRTILNVWSGKTWSHVV